MIGMERLAMSTSLPRGGFLERGAPADLWRHTLSQIPSVFGRLVYLSSIRGANTGVYEHHGLALLFGEAEADRALRRSHEDAFADWLNFTLEQQKADLDLYLSALTGTRRTIVDTWIRLMPYRNVVPASARRVERKLFLTDFDALLHGLKFEYGVGDPNPDA
jgi:hypothetical protein